MLQNQNNNIQSETQNATGAVIWSNQEESDEASDEYILTMVDIEIESTTPQATIFQDVIAEDNDQDNIEEENNNDISLFEFKEEEVFMNEDTNAQDEVEEKDEQHFGSANDLELSFNKNKNLLMDRNVWNADWGASKPMTPQGWHDSCKKDHIRSNLGQWNKKIK